MDGGSTDSSPKSVSPEDRKENGSGWIDEDKFRKEYPVLWWVTLIGPFAASILILLGVWYFAGPKVMGQLVTTAFATFFFLGKFVILGSNLREFFDTKVFFSREQLFLLVLYMDLATACLLTFHLGLLYKIPVVGERLVTLSKDGHFILESNPWMKRATFIGLVAFVTFPLAASGSVGGTIFARLLGMSRLWTLFGIGLGSVLGCGMMYFGSGLINQYVKRDNPWLIVGGVVFIGIVIWVLNQRYQQLKSKQSSRQKSTA